MKDYIEVFEDHWVSISYDQTPHGHYPGAKSIFIHYYDGVRIQEQYIMDKLEYKIYYKNGLVHRENGPAYLDYMFKKIRMEYFINDKKIPNRLITEYPEILKDKHLQKILL